MPTSLLALRISGNRASRITSPRALLSMVAAVLVSKFLALLWATGLPVGEDGDIYPAPSEHCLTPSIPIAIILATGLTLQAAQAPQVLGSFSGKSGTVYDIKL